MKEWMQRNLDWELIPSFPRVQRVAPVCNLRERDMKVVPGSDARAPAVLGGSEGPGPTQGLPGSSFSPRIWVPVAYLMFTARQCLEISMKLTHPVIAVEQYGLYYFTNSFFSPTGSSFSFTETAR